VISRIGNTLLNPREFTTLVERFVFGYDVHQLIEDSSRFAAKSGSLRQLVPNLKESSPQEFKQFHDFTVECVHPMACVFVSEHQSCRKCGRALVLEKKSPCCGNLPLWAWKLSWLPHDQTLSQVQDLWTLWILDMRWNHSFVNSVYKTSICCQQKIQLLIWPYSLLLPQRNNLTWACDPMENQYLINGQLKTVCDLNKLETWARALVSWYWSANTLFW